VIRLYLMRHATAGSLSDGSGDTDPPLTTDGVAKARGAARGLVKLGVDPAILLTSPLLRAVQTAQIVSQELGIPVDRIRRTDTLKPGSAPGLLVEELSRVEGETALCVGHAPLLDDVIAHLLGTDSRLTALKKASVACLELAAGGSPQGLLLWLFPQKILRRLGR
jgi:phosphohistidine phosphatase